jgi:hypothetical protein
MEEGIMIKKGAICSVCHQPVTGNVNPSKILTCGRCVIALVDMEPELKVYYRDKLNETGHVEAARSIESFIIPEETHIEVRTLGNKARFRHSKHAVRHFNRHSK